MLWRTPDLKVIRARNTWAEVDFEGAGELDCDGDFGNADAYSDQSQLSHALLQLKR